MGKLQYGYNRVTSWGIDSKINKVSATGGKKRTPGLLHSAIIDHVPYPRMPPLLRVLWIKKTR